MRVTDPMLLLFRTALQRVQPPHPRRLRCHLLPSPKLGRADSVSEGGRPEASPAHSHSGPDSHLKATVSPTARHLPAAHPKIISGPSKFLFLHQGLPLTPDLHL